MGTFTTDLGTIPFASVLPGALFGHTIQVATPPAGSTDILLPPKSQRLILFGITVRAFLAPSAIAPFTIEIHDLNDNLIYTLAEGHFTPNIDFLYASGLDWKTPINGFGAVIDPNHKLSLFLNNANSDLSLYITTYYSE